MKSRIAPCISSPRNWVSSLSQALVFCLILFAVIKQFRFYFNGDLGWHLVVAEWSAQGKTLYHDIFEINPPFVFDLTNAWFKLGAFFKFEPMFFLNVLNLSVTALSFVLMGWVLKGTPYWPFAAAFICFLHPMDNGIGSRLGQKEHLFLMLAAPYLFNLCDRGIKKSKWPLSVLAGFGFMIKPFFLLLFLAAFAWVFWDLKSQKKTDPIGTLFKKTWQETDTAIILLLQALFLLWVLWIHPSYYFEVLPVGLETYVYYGFPGWATLINSLVMGVLFYGMGLVIVPPLWRFLPRRSVYAIYLAFFAMVMVWIQRKGWAYQKQPMEAFLLWASFFFWPVALKHVKEAVSRGGWFYLEPPSVSALLFFFYQAIFLGFVFSFLFRSDERVQMSQYDGQTQLEAVLREDGPHQTAFAWFHGTQPSFPAVNDLKLKWVGTVNTFLLWDGMQSFRKYRSHETVEQIKARFPKSQALMQKALLQGFAAKPHWLWIALEDKKIKTCLDLNQGLETPGTHYHRWIDWSPEVTAGAQRYRCVSVLPKTGKIQYALAVFKRLPD